MTIYDNNKVMILIMVIIMMIVKITRIKIEKIKSYGNILEQKKKSFYVYYYAACQIQR